MPTVDTDVLVIGSGPAGSAAALALPTYGVRTLVITKCDQPAAPTAVATLRRALGGGDHPVEDPARALWDLAGGLGAPRSLAELGMAEADVARIAEQAVANPYANPRPVTLEGVTALLHAAWAGGPPAGGGTGT